MYDGFARFLPVPADDNARRLGVPAKPDYHGGGEHGAHVQLRRAEAAEGGRS